MIFQCENQYGYYHAENSRTSVHVTFYIENYNVMNHAKKDVPLKTSPIFDTNTSDKPTDQKQY